MNDEFDKLKDRWQKLHQGAERAHVVGFLEETREEAIDRHLKAAENILGAVETPAGAGMAIADPFLVATSHAHALLAIAYALAPDIQLAVAVQDGPSSTSGPTSAARPSPGRHDVEPRHAMPGSQDLVGAGVHGRVPMDDPDGGSRAD